VTFFGRNEITVPDQDATRKNPRRLIVIGDALRTVVPGNFSISGFRVVGHAKTALEATELLAIERPDVALVAVQESDDPTENLLSAAGPTQAVAVVAAAQSYNADLAQRALAAGAITFVTSPFTRERLTPALEMAIARHADATELRNTINAVTTRLDDHKLIERAKGVLMFRYRFTEAESFRSIELTAMDRQISLREVAIGIIEHNERLARARSVG